jgi:hypothetical protein
MSERVSDTARQAVASPLQEHGSCFASCAYLLLSPDFKGDPPILQKIAAGLTTSAIGITVASPTDVVKVRLQAEGRLPEGAVRRYNGALDAYRKIVATEGIKGLWTGYGPNLARNCVSRDKRRCNTGIGILVEPSR